VLFDGGAADRVDLYIPPMIVEVSTADALMEEEVRRSRISHLQ